MSTMETIAPKNSATAPEVWVKYVGVFAYLMIPIAFGLSEELSYWHQGARAYALPLALGFLALLIVYLAIRKDRNQWNAVLTIITMTSMAYTLYTEAHRPWSIWDKTNSTPIAIIGFFGPPILLIASCDIRFAHKLRLMAILAILTAPMTFAFSFIMLTWH